VIDMTELSKMDPMARKLGAEVESFHKAIDSGNVTNARYHINEIQKFAQFLASDIESAVTKADDAQGVNDIYAGGVPVRKFEQTERSYESNPNVLAGYVRASSVRSPMKQLSQRDM
jgi:antirestriction protein ArdC